MKTYKLFLYQRFSYAILISLIDICLSLFADVKWAMIIGIQQLLN